MIFDDHDVRDDWNTSQVLAGGHAGHRAGGRSASSAPCPRTGCTSTWATCRRPNWPTTSCTSRSAEFDGDAEPLLREFAEAADREADGAKGARWSYRRDFGPVRLLVIDSRCGRILDQGRRSMLSDAEFDWIDEQLTGDYDHLLIGTSLPWLLPRAFHDIEAWNELLCDGQRGRLVAAISEKIRRAADFEHWAAFRESFETALRDDRRRSAAVSTPRMRAAHRPPSACCPAMSTTPTSPAPSTATTAVRPSTS